MPTIAFVDAAGNRTDVEVPAGIFDVQVNVPAMHEAVKAELAAARAGTHSTKTRAEVRGGGRKPWRQKGTGRARHGSIREPQWVGGGVAHGPKPRIWSIRVNKKVRVLALRSALTDRARGGQVVVVDLPPFAEPQTKQAVELLGRWGATGKTLLVLGHPGEQVNVWKSFRNLPNVLSAPRPTTYTVLAADTVVFTRQALEALTGVDKVSLPAGTPVAAAAPEAKAPKPVAPPSAAPPPPPEAPEAPAPPVAAEAPAEAPQSSPEAPSAGPGKATGFFREEASRAGAEGEPESTEAEADAGSGEEDEL